KIGPDPRNFNQRVSLGRNDLLIRTFPNSEGATMQLLDLFAGLLWLSSVIFLLYLLDVVITRYLYRK
ncbi:hypothetical protein, partial [Klebsiella variicola]